MNGRKRGGAAGLATFWLILLVAVLSACSGGDGVPEEAGRDSAVAPEMGSPAPPATAGAGDGGFAFGGDAAKVADMDEATAERPAGESSSGVGQDGSPGGLSVAESSLGRKVISNATLQVEVETGRFQTAFDQALLLADRYGGYVVASQASGTGEDSAVRSGTVTIRVPSTAFSRVLTDAGKLGELRSREIDSQDVTEEFLDLQARLENAQAQERSLRSLLDQAKTIEEILQVRQVLSSTQAEIEQLKGRLRFLDEHTSFSTVTISVFESGVQLASVGSWGLLQALRDAARAFVGTLNGMIVGFGEALPVLIAFGFIIWLAYRLLRPALSRRLAESPSRGPRDDEHPAA